jgi:hypothetical protein
MMSGTSRSSAKGTTEPTATEEAGSPVSKHETWPEADWNDSMGPRETISYLIWEGNGRLFHRFGHHTFVDHESWSSDGPITVVYIAEQICWFCDKRRPVLPARIETFHR